VNEADCQKQIGIQKDYCLKDLAISEEDSEICAQIQDTNIKKTCTNRLMEDFLEEQGSSESPDY
jgi:hypothetical protein